MTDNKNENHPFEEEGLKHALSESLQPTPRPDFAGSDSDEPVKLPYDDEDELAPETEPAELDSLMPDDDLNYGDLEEAWQEREEHDRPFAEDDYEDEDEDEDEDGVDPEDMLATDDHVYPVNSDASNIAPPAAPDSPAKPDSSNSPGMSRIVIAIIVLCAVGFTASNWMANQKVDALTARLENIEALLNDQSTINSGPDAHQNIQQNEAADQKNEAVLMQLSAQVMENRDTIEALKQSLAQASTAPPPMKPKAEATRTDAPADTSQRLANEAPPAAAEQAVEKSAEPPKPVAASPVSANKGPGWNIVLMSLKNEEMAGRELANLKKNGIQAELHTVTVKGTIYHQLRVGWFEQKDDALAYIKNVIMDLGYKDAWIRRTE